MSRFGKFHLLAQIGGGRLSEVFRVSRVDAPEVSSPGVALKRVLPSVIGEPAFVQLVVREAGLLARLSHPNLCQCHEMGVVDGCAFLTLDLVKGCTLRALLRRISRMGVELPTSAIVALGHQLAQVLHYLHHQCDTPLVHLDLSPQNVMIDGEGTLKLIDFGIARFLDGLNPPPLGGKIAGTVGYMSPEQARGTALDARADQFAVGILMWEMLTRQRAFRGNTPETWDRMRSGTIPDAEQALRDVHSGLAQTLRRLLEPEPEQRFAHIGELARELEQITSDPATGQRPLAALVQHLRRDPSFDPFDVVRRKAAPELAADIPSGDAAKEQEYAELSIQVDHGQGTPSSQIRAAVAGDDELPDSPFLETIPEPRATAEIGR